MAAPAWAPSLKEPWHEALEVAGCCGDRTVAVPSASLDVFEV